MSNDGIKIKCRYCGNNYFAYKKGRTHCRRTTCRMREIKKQLSELERFIELFCNNHIESIVEIRLAGNDKLSPEAKIESFSILGEGFQEKNNQDTGGIKLNELISYFEPLLWKEVRGNFIIKTLSDGTVYQKLLSQTFTNIANPIIIGNNIIVSGQSKLKGGNIS